MVWYDIYLLQLGLHPVVVVGNLCKTTKRHIGSEGETIHKTRNKQIENRTRKQIYKEYYKA